MPFHGRHAYNKCKRNPNKGPFARHQPGLKSFQVSRGMTNDKSNWVGIRHGINLNRGGNELWWFQLRRSFVIGTFGVGWQLIPTKLKMSKSTIKLKGGDQYRSVLKNRSENRYVYVYVYVQLNSILKILLLLFLPPGLN